MKTKQQTEIYSVEEFARLSSDKIARLLRKDKTLHIIGEIPGVDRKIIKYENTRKHKNIRRHTPIPVKNKTIKKQRS